MSGRDEDYSNGHFEKLLEELEDQIAQTDDPKRPGQLFVRAWRLWITHHWIPHNRAEMLFKAQVVNYVWTFRVGVGIIVALGGVMAWALTTALNALQIILTGSSGP